ncbi:hypothetical protein MSG28_014742 [Choristoneura fumiferana]|uniref:Uncharacterized protein n=1 Tax=Choristoneura fumiferana TaxID=7141 RepID=A0ACC0JSV3_CHOFU|nr:hypothetical protein MSG28_014742 [Choristoneura fumiferana]
MTPLERRSRRRGCRCVLCSHASSLVSTFCSCRVNACTERCCSEAKPRSCWSSAMWDGDGGAVKCAFFSSSLIFHSQSASMSSALAAACERAASCAVRHLASIRLFLLYLLGLLLVFHLLPLQPLPVLFQSQNSGLQLRASCQRVFQLRTELAEGLI